MLKAISLAIAQNAALGEALHECGAETFLAGHDGAVPHWVFTNSTEAIHLPLYNLNNLNLS